MITESLQYNNYYEYLGCKVYFYFRIVIPKYVLMFKGYEPCISNCHLIQLNDIFP